MNRTFEFWDSSIVPALVDLAAQPWTFQRLAVELFMSASEVHAAVRRAAAARLMSEASSAGRPMRAQLLEFLVHGLKYAFPPDRGPIARGVPTGYAAPPLNKIIAGSSDPPPVWPHAQGTVRGYALTPLYRTVADAALRDSALYELLALVDAIRDGRARERKLAQDALEKRLKPAAA